MTYNDSFSPDAAEFNQDKQRLNGVLNFDTRNAWNKGPAALDYGSGGSIEWEVDGSNLLIDGSKVGAPENTVTLSDGDPDLWRTDHIYASEDGAYNKLEGEPGSNEYHTHKIADAEMVSDPPDNVLEDNFEEGDVVHLVYENTQAGGPAPKGQPFDRKKGELIFSILVPPGATSIDEFDGEQHVLDRRRPAIDLLNVDRPRTSSISTNTFSLEPDEWKLWQLPAWADHTLRLWDYAISQLRYGFFSSSNFEIYLVDWSKRPGWPDETLDYNDGDVDWSEMAVWESDEPRQSPQNNDGPVVDIDLPSSGVEPLALVVKNVNNSYTYQDETLLSLSATYTIDATNDL